MFIPESIVYGIIGTIIGVLIGNRLALGRERRKEFNELIDPVRTALLRQRNHPRRREIVDDIILFKTREMLPFWKRNGFDWAIEQYKKSKETYHKNLIPNGMGGFEEGEKAIEDKAAISHSADRLLKYLKPR